MKIHKINTLNIASLLGESSIDLDGKLNDPNIFLVTGPVGSGKTTLFDAVCLGLFGATPRRPKAVSSSKSDIELDPKDPRAVISTGTVEGLAEVVFSKVEKGNQRIKYRARWSVERTHKKSRTDGNFKAPDRSLERLEGGEWKLLVSDEQEKVVKPIFDEVLEGMTLKEFNRAVLLPQGKFGQLLSAKQEDRAEILERVTQTDSYTKIGAKAKARFDATKKALEIVERRIGDNSPMTPEARAEVENERDGVNVEVTKLAKEKSSLSARVSWLAELDERTRDVEECGAAVEAALEASKGLNEEREAVATNIARAPLYQLSDKVLENALEIRGVTESIESHRAKLTTQNALCDQAAAAVNGAKSDLVESSAAFDMAEPKIRKGRDLTSKIEECSRQLDSAKERADELVAATLGKAEALASGESALAEAESELATHRVAVESRPYLAQYMDTVATITLSAAELESAEGEQSIAKSELEQLQQELLKYQSAMTESEVLVAAASDAFSVAKAAVESAKGGFATLLEVKEGESVEQLMDRLRSEVSAAERRGVELNHLRAQLERLAEADVAHEAEREALVALEAALVLEAGAVSDCDASVAKAESKLEKAKADAAVDSFAMGLISERDKLNDGDRCQLCGSEDHPYVTEFDQRELTEQLRARASASEAAEASALEDFSECKAAHVQATLKLAGTKATVDAARASVDAHGANIVIEREKAHSSAEASGISGELNLQVIDAAVEAALAEVDTKNGMLGQLADASKELVRLQEVQREAQVTLESEKSSRDIASASMKSTKGTIVKAEATAERVDKAVESRRGKLTNELRPFVLGSDPSGEVGELTIHQSVELLGQQVSQAAAAVRLVTEGMELVSSLKSEVDLAKQACVEAKKQSERGTKDLSDSQSSLSLVQTELATLFGDATPDALEATLKSAINAATERLETAVTAAEGKAKVRDTLNGQLEILASRSVSLKETQQGNENALETKMSEANCDSLEQLLTTRLTVEDMAEKQEILRGVDDELLKAKSAQEHAAGSLKKHKLELPPEWADSEESQESLQQRLAAQTAQYDEANQRLGKLQNDLDNDDSKKNRASELLAELEECQREYNLWARMQRLIGRNDGKAFRNAAQVLNLGDLIDRANPHLKKLSGRYSLSHRLEKKKRHDKDKEGYLCPTLSFSIIDGFQADRARDIQSLGGGDSFLVSLSLALGLASYQTVKMPIETLLLDEGFGTLDQDTLHTAMQTLEHIYESNGTQVGLISHVEGLKRHIQPQVQVTKIGESGWSKAECVVVGVE